VPVTSLVERKAGGIGRRDGRVAHHRTVRLRQPTPRGERSVERRVGQSQATDVAGAPVFRPSTPTSISRSIPNASPNFCRNHGGVATRPAIAGRATSAIGTRTVSTARTRSPRTANASRRVPPPSPGISSMSTVSTTVFSTRNRVWVSGFPRSPISPPRWPPPSTT
jgi:hypothetical protein